MKDKYNNVAYKENKVLLNWIHHFKDFVMLVLFCTSKYTIFCIFSLAKEELSYGEFWYKIQSLEKKFMGKKIHECSNS